MPKHTWEAKRKAFIVLEGLKGQPVAEICHEYQSSPEGEHHDSPTAELLPRRPLHARLRRGPVAQAAEDGQEPTEMQPGFKKGS
jgi:hypothetical protein